VTADALLTRHAAAWTRQRRHRAPTWRSYCERLGTTALRSSRNAPASHRPHRRHHRQPMRLRRREPLLTPVHDDPRTVTARVREATGASDRCSTTRVSGGCPTSCGADNYRNPEGSRHARQIDGSACGSRDVFARPNDDRRLALGSTFELAWPAASFDVVILINGIRGGCQGAVHEMPRAIRPDGMIGISFWGKAHRSTPAPASSPSPPTPLSPTPTACAAPTPSPARRRRDRSAFRRLAGCAGGRPDVWVGWKRGDSQVASMSGQCPDGAAMPPMGDPAVRPSRRHRREVRVIPEQDALIRQAADLGDHGHRVRVRLRQVEGEAGREAAPGSRPVERAFDRFIAELDKPAKPVPELVALFKSRPKLREA
jgi:uncharacterized protein (DUF1778 family)